MIIVLAAWLLGGLALAVVVGAAVRVADARREPVVPLADPIALPVTPAAAQA